MELDDEDEAEEERVNNSWLEGNDMADTWNSSDLGQSPELNESDI